MKRTTLALLLSLALHLSLLAFLYKGIPENQQSLIQSTPISLQISTVVTHIEEPKSEPAAQEQTVPREPEPSKNLPKKEKPKKPISRPLPQTSVENNASVPFVDASPSPTTASETVHATTSETPSYLAQHKDEIIQALQRAKAYPELARKRSIEGVVEVSFTIKPTGEVEEVEATSSSKILSASAIESVHKAKVYFPHPLENVTIKIPINYILK